MDIDLFRRHIFLHVHVGIIIFGVRSNDSLSNGAKHIRQLKCGNPFENYLFQNDDYHDDSWCLRSETNGSRDSSDLLFMDIVLITYPRKLMNTRFCSRE